MKCNDVLARLSEQLDGRLAAAEAAEFTDHLNQCGDCAGMAAEHRLLANVMATDLPEAVPPVDRMWQAIRAELPSQAQPVPGWLAGMRELLAGKRLVLIPAGIAAIAAAVYFGGGGLSQSPEQLARTTGGSGRATIHASGDEREIGEAMKRRLDSVESGVRAYARTIRSRHGLR